MRSTLRMTMEEKSKEEFLNISNKSQILTKAKTRQSENESKNPKNQQVEQKIVKPYKRSTSVSQKELHDKLINQTHPTGIYANDEQSDDIFDDQISHDPFSED